MKRKLENQVYDTALFPTEWRFSAAIVGLIRYFEYHHISYQKDCKWEGWEGIAYNEKDLTEARFLEFAESWYGASFPHKKAEQLLKQGCSRGNTWTEEQIKEINDSLKGNTILKKIVKVKFDGSNQEEILAVLEENRETIMKETFRNKSNMYAGFANSNLLFTEENPNCRLLGYNVDKGRKTRSLSYGFHKDAFQVTDIREFDWIPFAFSDTYESFFVNNNLDIHALCHTADKLKEIMERSREKRESDRTVLLKSMAEIEGLVEFDVEVISKRRDREYFESLYIRKEALQAMKELPDLALLDFRYKLGEGYWLNVQEEVLDCCINQMSLDSLIEQLLKLKEREQIGYLQVVIGQLIRLNVEWSDQMDKENKRRNIYIAKDYAKQTVEKLRREKKENKIRAYRQKLISAITFHDYDRVNEILLQLSDYAKISYPFVYCLFEDGEENKEVAFAFANALEAYEKESKEEKEA